MKGVLLCGGAGKRLRPLTHTGAKQLVPIANRPIAELAIEKLAEAGVDDILVIISPETGDELVRTFGDGSRFGVSLSFQVQEKPLGLAQAVSLAEEFVGGQPFCVFLGDNVIGDTLHRFIADFWNDALEARIMLKAVKDPRAFGVAVVDERLRCIASLQEKPQHPASDLAMVGAYLFKPSVFEAIRTLKPSARGELEITDAISWLVSNTTGVGYTELEGWWLDTGKRDDLLLANETVIDYTIRCPQVDPGAFIDRDSVVSGRVRIGAGSRILGSVVRGPAVIGSDVLVEGSVIGPFTSVGNSSSVSSSELDRCLIMEDCVVDHVGRLSDTVLGRRAKVSERRVGLRRSTSMIVGDDCEVNLIGS